MVWNSTTSTDITVCIYYVCLIENYLQIINIKFSINRQDFEIHISLTYHWKNYYNYIFLLKKKVFFFRYKIENTLIV